MHPAQPPLRTVWIFFGAPFIAVILALSLFDNGHSLPGWFILAMIVVWLGGFPFISSRKRAAQRKA